VTQEAEPMKECVQHCRNTAILTLPIAKWRRTKNCAISAEGAHFPTIVELAEDIDACKFPYNYVETGMHGSYP
jgi:hypothetical protein